MQLKLRAARSFDMPIQDEEWNCETTAVTGVTGAFTGRLSCMRQAAFCIEKRFLFQVGVAETGEQMKSLEYRSSI